MPPASSAAAFAPSQADWLKDLSSTLPRSVTRPTQRTSAFAQSASVGAAFGVAHHRPAGGRSGSRRGTATSAHGSAARRGGGRQERRRCRRRHRLHHENARCEAVHGLRHFIGRAARGDVCADASAERRSRRARRRRPAHRRGVSGDRPWTPRRPPSDGDRRCSRPPR